MGRLQMSFVHVDDILRQLRDLSSDQRGKGRLFERLIASFLARDPKYSNLLEHVWLWDEWPDRWGQDIGIDIVARETTGDYWAVQCKFFDPDHTIRKPDIDSFLSASGKQFAANDGIRQFARRIVVSSTNKWNRNAEKAIEGQAIPVSRIGLSNLAESPIDWSEFNLKRPHLIKRRPKKTLRPHQDEAISAVLSGFKTSDRGQLIMACGTGKTFTALRLAESIVASAKNGGGGGYCSLHHRSPSWRKHSVNGQRKHASRSTPLWYVPIAKLAEMMKIFAYKIWHTQQQQMLTS